MAAIGETLHIAWTSTDWLDPDGNPLPMMIELSRDGGGTWETIVASTADDGAYDWVVTGAVSSNCLFRFSDPADATVYFDGSPFSITVAGGTIASTKKGMCLSLSLSM